jgi:uncharacterized oxidoreductase
MESKEASLGASQSQGKGTQMNLSNNTILITGGSSGIGLGLAAAFTALDNTVIVTGRDRAKLDQALRKVPKLRVVRSDVTDPEAVVSLYASITQQYPNLNVLINNAGIMRKVNLQDARIGPLEVTREIDTNLIAPIRMTKQFLPHLQSQPSAAIVNVSSGLAFVPFPISPVYSATKAALHSFTLSLRVQLLRTYIKVFELMPPGTDTPLFTGDFDAQDVVGLKPMPVDMLVAHALAGLRKDELEIKPGLSNVLQVMSRAAPRLMLRQLSKSAKHMQTHTQG